ncbi:amidase domain-containing protein [Streptomyces sp. NPDC047928]|uniref:amidase domain-containing protein n=1 Tax=unclassified Streptomyces TaxID=2593676 RepID=UPI00372165D6
MLQSWMERGTNEGLVLTAPVGATGASYHSGAAADASKRPQLVVEYVPPTAPGAASDIRVGAGDTALLATWNAPLDPGAAGEEPRYTVRLERADGSMVAEQETSGPRAVFSGLDNALTYRVAVTPKNSFGAGAVSRSTLTQGATVAGGAAQYGAYVQEYLDARGKIMTGASLIAADAAAEAPRGSVFRELLSAQEAGLVGGREGLETQGQSYGSASYVLSDVVVSKGTGTDVVVRATVTETVTIRTAGMEGEEQTGGRASRRFTFNVSGESAVLASEVDDTDAGLTLSATVAAETQVEASSIENSDVPSDDPGSIPLGENGFPAQEAAAFQLSAFRAASVNGHGTGNWAYNNTGVKWEYPQDCTNFVSKALYYGGGMKFRWGGRKTDGAWWQQYYLFGSVKNKSYTWSGAENLRRHFSGHRPATRVAAAGSARVGDIIFFKWKNERVYNHAAVVTANARGNIALAQHGRNSHTTLNDILTYYRSKKDPIERIVIIRPTSAK